MGKCSRCGCIAYVWNPAGPSTRYFGRFPIVKSFNVLAVESDRENDKNKFYEHECMCGHDEVFHTHASKVSDQQLGLSHR